MFPQSRRVLLSSTNKTYIGWYNNPKKGRFPRVYKPTVWLTPKASYNVDFEAMTVRIASVGDLPILGYPRLITLYKTCFTIRKGKNLAKLINNNSSCIFVLAHFLVSIIDIIDAYSLVRNWI